MSHCFGLLLLLLATTATGFQGFSPFDLMRLQGIDVPEVRTEDDSDDPSARPTYDELYVDAIDAYEKQSWTEAIRLMEKAIADYEAERDAVRTCKTTCDNNDGTYNNVTALEVEYAYFHAILARYQCVRSCVRDAFATLGLRSSAAVSADVLNAFDRRIPYMYLQLAYFNAGEKVKAARSAATYLYYNPDDEIALSNARYYEGLPEVTDDVFKPIDMMTHMESFESAVALYDEGDKWDDVIDLFEKSLAEYLTEWKNCRLLCDGRSIEPTNGNLDNLLGNHVTALLKCRGDCALKLGTNRKGKVYGDFFEKIFHYLQFAYYKAGNLKSAVECAMTYLLYHPEDEVMVKNVGIYKEAEGVKEEYFTPRQDIVSKFNVEEAEKKLLTLTAGSDEEADFRKNMEEDEAKRNGTLETVDLKFPQEPEIETPPTTDTKTATTTTEEKEVKNQTKTTSTSEKKSKKSSKKSSKKKGKGKKKVEL